MGVTTYPEEIAAIYERFPWLEKIYPQANVDHFYVKTVEDVSVFANNSIAYLKQEKDGIFYVRKYLWPGAYLFSGYPETQWQGMDCVVLVNNRCVTVLCNAS